MTVRVKKLGGSVAIVIPKSIADEMELSAGTELDVTRQNDAMLVRRARRRARRPIDELVKEIDPAAYERHRKIFDDRPVGKEIW